MLASDGCQWQQSVEIPPNSDSVRWYSECLHVTGCNTETNKKVFTLKKNKKTQHQDTNQETEVVLSTLKTFLTEKCWKNCAVTVTQSAIPATSLRRTGGLDTAVQVTFNQFWLTPLALTSILGSQHC